MEKFINDFLVKEINIGPIYPLVQTEQFQKLRERHQMGVGYYAFPNTVHKRFMHSLAVYQLTLERTERWLKKEIINKNEAQALCIYALLHDIGHGPFSHVIEPLISTSHEKNGARVIHQIKSEIEDCGADFSLVSDIFEENNPLYQAVLDKVLGTDKFEYIQRDAFLSGYGGQPEITRVERGLIFKNKKLIIKIRDLDDAKNLQSFYMRMFKRLYLSKSMIIIQTAFQKIIMRLIELGLTEEELWPMTDIDLLTRIEINAQTDDILRHRRNNFQKRKLPKLTISFRLKKQGAEERLAEEKNIKVYEIGRSKMNQLGNIPFKEALNLENKIAQITGLPQESLLIVPIVGLGRFKPSDIYYHDGQEIKSIFEEDEGYLRYLEKEADSYIAFRICVFEEHKTELLKHAKEVKEFILALVK